MKVLHFFKTYYPDTHGGIEEVIYQLAEHGTQYGIDTQVLALSRKDSVREERYQHHIVHRSHTNLYLASTAFSWSAFRDFSELAHGADLIHYHFPWPFADLVHFATRTGKPTLVTYHSDIVKQQVLKKLYQPLQNRFLKSVDRIVTTSPNYAISSPILPQFKQKLSVIPIGIQDTYLTVQPERTLLHSWQKRLPERFFLFLGALRYYKGLTFLLEAARITNYPIVIAGAGPDERALKAQTKQLGLNRVYFTGPLTEQDKLALLRLCYAFVFPSHIRSEAFGIALLEAAMHGKALISCEIGTGTSYINLNEVTGLTVPGANSGALANAMQRLWNFPKETTRFGEKARLRYLELFTADIMTHHYVELYHQLVHSHSLQETN